MRNVNKMAIDIELYGKQFEKDYNNQDFEVILTKYRKKKIVEIMANYITNNILEIGCGMEPFFLCYDAFEKMTIVEPATVLFQSVERYCRESTKNIECIHDFVENREEELKEKKFDFILLVGLIHEVEDPEKLVQAVRAICTEDTRVLITTNNPNSFHLTLAYEAGLIPKLGILTDKAKSFQRHSTFTMEQMEKLAIRHSFQILEKGSYFIKPFAHSQMKALLDQHIISEAVLDGLDKMVKYMPELGAENYCVVKPV